MQHMADDFTSIRQEMERIEAERGRVTDKAKPALATGGTFTLPEGYLSPVWAIGTVKLQGGQIHTFADLTDVSGFTSSADRYPQKRPPMCRTALFSPHDYKYNIQLYGNKGHGETVYDPPEVELISFEVCSDGITTEVYQ